MSEAFVYIGSWTIKPGKLEEAHKQMAQIVEFVEANEPRMIGFHVFFDDDNQSCTVVQLHPDCASMEYHMQVGAAHFATAFEFIDKITHEQYYGTISDGLGAELAKWDDPTVPITKVPLHDGGFTRTTVR